MIISAEMGSSHSLGQVMFGLRSCPAAAAAAHTFFTTSMPSTTEPNTTCLPSEHVKKVSGVGGGADGEEKSIEPPAVRQ